jgi:hypothetical protein
MSIYVIKHKQEDLYWSNRFGWIEDGPDMDIFYNNEADKRVLPKEGKWTLLKSLAVVFRP